MNRHASVGSVMPRATSVAATMRGRLKACCRAATAQGSAAFMLNWADILFVPYRERLRLQGKPVRHLDPIVPQTAPAVSRPLRPVRHKALRAPSQAAPPPSRSPASPQVSLQKQCTFLARKISRPGDSEIFDHRNEHFSPSRLPPPCVPPLPHEAARHDEDTDDHDRGRQTYEEARYEITQRAASDGVRKQQHHGAERNQQQPDQLRPLPLQFLGTAQKVDHAPVFGRCRRSRFWPPARPAALRR